MAVAAHYLKILDQGGHLVEGESEGHGHIQEIDVTGWNWDVSDQTPKDEAGTAKDKAGRGTAAGSAGASAGGAEVGIEPSLFTFTKTVDRSTTRLMRAMDRGEVLKKATFTLLEELLTVHDVRRSAFRLNVVLENVIVVSYELGGRSSDFRVDLDETWGFNYSKISFDYESAGMYASFDRNPGSSKQGASKPAVDIQQMQKKISELTQAASAKGKRG